MRSAEMTTSVIPACTIARAQSMQGMISTYRVQPSVAVPARAALQIALRSACSIH